MPTYSFAIQPASWSTFDEHGCVYCTDINHAYRLCQSEPDMMIWGIPNNPKSMPIKWCRPDANSNAVAQLVYGKGL